MSSSAAFTSNPIYWLFSSGSLLTSTTKQSFLVRPHPESDHAALITEASQGIPSHHWQRNNIHLQLSVPPLRLATSGLRLGGGGSMRAIYRTHASADFTPQRSAPARLTRQTLQGTSWNLCGEQRSGPRIMTTASHLSRESSWNAHLQ